MSVKLMTTESIRDDLETIAITWPDGVPATQVDRMNALKAELKRRGENANAPNGAPSKAGTGRRNVKSMDREELEQELRTLSKAGSLDDDAQDRFADVRYELRYRLVKKDLAEDELPPGPPPPPLPARQLELPDEDEMELARREREIEDSRKAAIAERPVSRRSDDRRTTKVDPQASAIARRVSEAPVSRPASGDYLKSGVNGYRAAVAGLAGGIAGVSLEYERRSPHGIVCVSRQFTVEQIDALIEMITMSRDAAAKANHDASLDDED